MPNGYRRTNGQRFLLFLAVFLGFILPIVIIFAGLFVFNVTSVPGSELPEGEVAGAEEALAPSEILNNKKKYAQKRLVMRGTVFLEPAVCERKECPADDPCCGCPDQRNLVIVDTGTVLRPKTKGRLRLLGGKGESFCQRSPLSCDYACPGWHEGVTYDVAGKFFATPPPPGWKLSLDYYFRLEDKTLVGRTAFGESVKNVFREIREMIEDWQTTGHYVLP